MLEALMSDNPKSVSPCDALRYPNAPPKLRVQFLLRDRISRLDKDLTEIIAADVENAAPVIAAIQAQIDAYKDALTLVSTVIPTHAG